MKEISPIISSTTATAIGRDTLMGLMAATTGTPRKTTATPRRAMAISTPIAKAISLPLNHFTMPRETVMPASSTPQPEEHEAYGGELGRSRHPFVEGGNGSTTQQAG